MPTLADIYSAINTAKRKGSDFVQNPGTSLQQMLGNANDQARGFNQLNDQALAEMQETGKLTGPAGQQLMQKISGAYNPIGMTAWHGSPHIFEKFDASKIGSGVGQQAYGKGLYLAESPATANEYKVNLSGYSSGAKAALRQSKDDFDVAMSDQVRKLEHYKNLVQSGGGGDINRANKFLQMTEQNIKDLEAMKQGIAENKGALYKVDLPDTHVRRMIDWDAPLKEQPKNVRSLAKQLGMDMNDLGGDLVSKVGKDEAGREILQKANIRGIKYINDQGLNSKEQTRNFVVFDPNHLTILERNSEKLK
jgi:hypothetical protein